MAANRLLKVNRVAQTAIIAGILVAGNVVAQRWFARLDLTERREYTLSPATRRMLAGLDDAVVVNAYFSRRLPPSLAHVRRQVQDLLEEYRAYSRGRLTLEFTDPGDDPAAAQRLRMMGIPQVQLEVLERDQFAVSAAYLGLALAYAGRQEVIPVVQDVGSLEYELTAALLRLTSPQRKSVGWLGAGLAEDDPRERGGNQLRRELAKLYDVRELQAAGLTEVPAEVQTLILAGPRGLDERARYAVDQFLMRGGRLVALVDHFDLPEGSLSPVPSESGVHDLLARYGAKVARDVVGEPHFNSPAAFSTGFMQFRLAYPYWVRVQREALDRESPITAKIESLVLPWASSMEPAVAAGGAVKATVLATSSPDAWSESGAYDFSPQPRRERPAAKGTPGTRTLALLLTGKFTSFWSDREPPAPAPAAPEGGKPGKAAGAAKAAAQPRPLRQSAETSILVVGTSRLVQPDFVRQFPENAAFLLNAVDWMTMGQDLIGIRSRTASEPAIDRTTDAQRTGLKAVNVIVVPLLIALIGLVRLNARRRRRAEA
jgi:gliding-associated putative ABC transporter substrate-binding component GldG